MNWVLVGAGLILFGVFLYWLLVTTEGVFLGRRVVVWLYDITAHRYDGIKQFNLADERLLVLSPILWALNGQSKPLILDVATGTGRVPFTLLSDPRFKGQIIGLDPSDKMLAVAAEKLLPLANISGRQANLVRQTANLLPFADETFDAVTCLEALEFFPSDTAALKEMVRVLRPGGFLMTTRRCGWEGKLFLNHYRSVETFERILREIGLGQVKISPWEVNYNLVTGQKLVLDPSEKHGIDIGDK